MSSEDNPPPSKNPFIRFKNHIDASIGNGISFITGQSSSTASASDTAAATGQSPPTNSSSAASHEMLFSDPRFGGSPPYGGFRTRFWNEWAQLSSYSPYNLRHLRQPTPSDLPAGVDAKTFGFQDAFEDLLAVSAGRPLMDLSKQARMKREILDYFGFNEPPMNWVWRLSADGLLPRPLPFRRQFSPGCGPGWTDPDGARDSQLASMDPTVMNKDVAELANLFKKAIIEADKVDAADWDNLKKRTDRLLDEAQRKTKEFEQEVERYSGDWIKRQTSCQAPKEDTDKTWPAEQGPQEKKSTSETDLLELIESTVAQADKTFTNFAKSLWEHSRPSNERAAAAAPAPALATTLQAEKAFQTAKNGKTTKTTTETDELGGKTIKSVSEWVDPAGWLHNEVEVVRMDAKGRVFSREDRSHLTPAPQNQSTSGEGFNASVTSSTTVEEQVSSDSDGKSTGWFWR